MRKPNILLVDDNEDFCDALASRFESKFHFQTANDVTTAKKIISHSSFHLIIVDYSLTGGTGLDVVSFLKRFDDKPQVIMISGISDKNLRDTCLESGIHAFMEKLADFIVIHHRLSCECTSGAAAT